MMVGCAPVSTRVKFEREDTVTSTKISGVVSGRFCSVQKFRSLLEAMEYRVNEKAK